MRNFLDYVYWNTRYLVSKPDFSYLARGEQLSFDALCNKLRNSYFTRKVESGKGKVNYYLAQFSLSALKIKGNGNLAKYARSKYNEIEVRLTAAADKIDSSVLLPMFDDITRIEYTVEQITLATALGVSARAMRSIILASKAIFNLNSAEMRVFDSVIDIYACKLYCVAVNLIGQNDALAEKLLCNVFKAVPNVDCLPYSVSNGTHFAQINSKELTAVADDYGNTSLCFCQIPATYPDKSPYLRGLTLTVADTVNVFSHFSTHKHYGNLLAFAHSEAGLSTDCKIFYKGNSEIRRYTVSNLYNKGRNLRLTFCARPLFSGGVFEYFKLNGSHCVRVSGYGSTHFYCLSLKGLDFQPKFVSNSYSCTLNLTAELLLKKRSKITFSIVTTLACDFTQLTAALHSVSALGFGQYHMLFCGKCVEPSAKQMADLHLRLPVVPQKKSITNNPAINSIAFTPAVVPPIVPYHNLMRFGDRFSFTLNDCGDNATLYKGYQTFFGENVYLIYGKKAVRLTEGRPIDCGDCLRYRYADSVISASLDLKIGEDKTFEIRYKTTKKVKVSALLVFGFTHSKLFDFRKNTFYSQDGVYNISVNAPCAYSSNRNSFVPSTLSFYPDNNLFASDFLCISAEIKDGFSATVFAETDKYQFFNTVSNCLLAEKLNYNAQKNVYLLDNFLAPCSAHCLSCSVICNPSFVRSYLERCLQNGYLDTLCLPYYSRTGNLVYQKERFTFTLAAVYYAVYTGDKSMFDDEKVDTFVRKQLLSVSDGDMETATQLLCLKKSFYLFNDNVPFVSKYEQMRRSLSAKQEELAVLLGALSSDVTPQKLHALYMKYCADVDKSRYYLTQFEVLYGVTYQDGLLSFSPKQSAVETDMTVTFADKIFNLHFKKGNPRTVLNGGTIYSAFSPALLRSSVNKVEIYY